jgi:allophanate hydrolase subunit 2
MVRSYAQVLNAGAYASIQDEGRFDYKRYGVPHSGALLSSSLHSVNEALENQANDAVIEFFGSGLTLRFSHDTILAFSKGGLLISINDEEIDQPLLISVYKGSIVKVLKNNSGWSYLGVKFGWQSTEMLGSKSMMKGVTYYERIVPGLALPYTSISLDQQFFITNKEEIDRPKPRTKFKFDIGPEIIKSGVNPTTISLTISSQSTRQAISFNEQIEGNYPEIISSFTPQATIQVTPSGKVFILSKDGQITGGYFRLGFVSLEDLESMHSLPFGTRIQLTPLWI